ncbi:MAG: hypothetical protein ACTHNK_19580, partial [Thermomicrobiales bacterium]
MRPATARRTRAVFGWDGLALLTLAVVLSASLVYAAGLAPTRLAFPVDKLPQGVELRHFYGVEQNGAGAFRWTNPGGVIVIPLTTSASYRIHITMQDSPVVQPPRSVTLRIDGRTLQTIQLTPSPHDYTITLPPTTWHSVMDQSTVEQEQLLLTLETRAYSAPGDPRALGVIITQVAIEPALDTRERLTALLVPNLLLLLALYLSARLAGAGARLAAALLGGVVATFAFVAIGGRNGALLLAYQPVVHWRQFGGMLSVIVITALLWRLVRPRPRRRTAHSAAPPAATTTSWRLAPAAWREVILLLLLLLVYGFTYQSFGWNETSRYDLVQALVDEHTTRIDRTHDNTGDKAFYTGHWYSDNAPGGALLGVPAYAALRGVAALTGAQPTRWQYWRACAFLGAVAPAILLVLLLLGFLRAYVDEWWALTIVLGYALGTIAYPFASLYFSHVAAACFLFASFFVLWRTPPGSRRWPLLLAGLLAGWAVLLEYPAALGVVALLIYAGARERRAPFLMALGALPPALILLGYNWISFGAPFVIGYSKLTNPYFRSGMSEGLAGVTWPKPGALAQILAGPRGLLRLSPWLAAAPFGLWSLRRPGAPRRELALGGAIAGLFLLYNAGYYQPLGGTTPGPRFLIAALPFVALLAAFAPRASQLLIATMIVCSVALLLLATLTTALPSQ